MHARVLIDALRHHRRLDLAKSFPFDVISETIVNRLLLGLHLMASFHQLMIGFYLDLDKLAQVVDRDGYFRATAHFQELSKLSASLTSILQGLDVLQKISIDDIAF